MLPDKKKPKEKATPKVTLSPGGTKNIPCQFHFYRGKCTKGSECKCSHQKSMYTPEWKKKFEEGPKRSNSPAGERPKNDGICSSWKKGACKKGKDCKFKHLKNSAPAEKDSDAESEAGSEKKRKKKKAKAAPVISTDPESEAEPTCSEEDIVDRDAETECLPATLNAKLYFPKKRGIGLSAMMVT